MFSKVGPVLEVFRRTSCGFCFACKVASKFGGEKHMDDSAEVKQAPNVGLSQENKSKWQGDEERSRSCSWLMLWSET